MLGIEREKIKHGSCGVFGKDTSVCRISVQLDKDKDGASFVAVIDIDRVKMDFF